MGKKYKKGELESYTHKLCIRCNRILLVENFRKCFGKKLYKYGWGYRSYCKDCERKMCSIYSKNNRKRRNTYLREWRRKNPELARKNDRKGRLKSKYKMTIIDYENLVKKQNKKCAICNQERPLVIDHDHKTGKVRGLLCRSCNHLLGLIELYPQNIIKYLNKNNCDVIIKILESIENFIRDKT